MTSGSAARVIRASGRIVVNPANAFATNSFPYGGIEIGFTKGLRFVPLGESLRVPCEALGEASDVLEAFNRFELRFTLRGWDDDAVQRLMTGGYEKGTISQHAVYYEPGYRVPGMSALGRAISLVFVPDDPINVPALLIYRGIPDVATGEGKSLHHDEEYGTPIVVDCIRDSSGYIYREGRLVDLALS